ncbi:MAG TPA: Lpg1974 family pore-forming outer membrane protein, partial [Caulobacteraceae bacterium]
FAFAGAQYESRFSRRHAVMEAEREFSGTGPALTWDAAMALWGDDQTGRLSVDWSVTAGALFGERETTILGSDTTVLHQGDLGSSVLPSGDRMLAIISSTLPVVDTGVVPISIPRSDDATVPFLDLSLGVSYDVGRIKLSTGYRWERYFDVLDVGQGEAKDEDRTIDGPYFKLSVGFGG